jgi:hypothetical protein
MARTPYFMQFSNPSIGGFPAVGAGALDGSSAANAVTGTTALLNTALAAGKDVYVNRGGICAPDLGGGVGANTVSTWFQVTAAPTATGRLGRILSWDGVDDSGVGMDPWTIDPGFYDATATSGTGGWTSIGSGKWTKLITFSGGTVGLKAMWAQAVRGVGIDATTRLELRQRSSAANCTAVGDWHQDVSVSGTVSAPFITMYTGGNSDSDSPARMMGGLVLSCNIDRWTRALQFAAAKRIEIVDPIQLLHGTMTFRNGAVGDVTEDIEIRDFRSWGSPVNSVNIASIAATTDHTGGHFRIRFVRPNLSTGTRAEASAADYATIGNWTGINHCVRIWGQVGEVSFVDPVMYGARHGCIEVQSDKSIGADSGYPRNLEFYGTRQGSATIDFPRNDPNGYYNAFGTDTSGSFSLHNFLITGVTKHAGVAGRARITNNHWKDFGYAIVPAASDDNGGVDGCIVFSLFQNSTADYATNTHDIDFANNIIENPWNWPMRIAHQFDALAPAYSLRIVGNTIIDLDHFYERKTYTQTTSGKTRAQLTDAASASIMVSNGSTSGTPGLYMTEQTLKDNIFVTPTSSILSWSVNGSSNQAGTLVAGDCVSDGTDIYTELVRTGNQHFTSVSAAGLGSSSYVPDLSSTVVGAASSTTPSIDLNGKVRTIPGTVGAVEPA